MLPTLAQRVIDESCSHGPPRMPPVRVSLVLFTYTTSKLKTSYASVQVQRAREQITRLFQTIWGIAAPPVSSQVLIGTPMVYGNGGVSDVNTSSVVDYHASPELELTQERAMSLLRFFEGLPSIDHAPRMNLILYDPPDLFRSSIADFSTIYNISNGKICRPSHSARIWIHGRAGVMMWRICSYYPQPKALR